MKNNTDEYAICTLRTAMIVIGLLFSACETTVEVDLPEQQPVLVVNSFFNPDSIWSVHLSRSLGILESAREFPAVENATVEVLYNDQLVSVLNHVGNGFYRSASEKPEIGKTYTLRASAPGFTPVSASDYIPLPVPIHSVEIVNSTRLANDLIEYDLNINFSDPLPEKNYYHLSVWTIQDTPWAFREAMHFTSTDPLILENVSEFDLTNYEFSDREAVLDDALIPNGNYQLKITLSLFSDPATTEVWVVLSAVTEAFFRYFQTSRLHSDTRDNPFAEPALVFNNIENGYGIFAAVSPYWHRVF